MFSPKQEITDAVKAIGEILDGKQRGDMLTYEELAGVGVERDHQSWGTIIGRVRRDLLRQRHIAVRPVNGVGYQLLTEKDQVIECSRDRNLRMRNQARRGLAEVGAVNDASLPDHLRLMRTRQMQDMTLGQSIAKSCMEIAVQGEERLPRRPAH